MLFSNLMIGYFLPCRIVVCEEGGSVKIGMPKTTAMISMVEDQNVQAIAEDIEKRLINAIGNSIQ